MAFFFLDILNCITECHPFVSKFEPSLTEMFPDLLSLQHQRGPAMVSFYSACSMSDMTPSC